MKFTCLLNLLGPSDLPFPLVRRSPGPKRLRGFYVIHLTKCSIYSCHSIVSSFQIPNNFRIFQKISQTSQWFNQKVKEWELLKKQQMKVFLPANRGVGHHCHQLCPKICTSVYLVVMIFSTLHNSTCHVKCNEYGGQGKSVSVKYFTLISGHKMLHF